LIFSAESRRNSDGERPVLYEAKSVFTTVTIVPALAP